MKHRLVAKVLLLIAAFMAVYDTAETAHTAEPDRAVNPPQTPVTTESSGLVAQVAALQSLVANLVAITDVQAAKIEALEAQNKRAATAKVLTHRFLERYTRGKDDPDHTMGPGRRPIQPPFVLELEFDSIVVMSVTGTVRPHKIANDGRLHLGFFINGTVSDASSWYTNPSWQSGEWRPFSMSRSELLKSGKHEISIGPSRNITGVWAWHFVNMNVAIIPLPGSAAVKHVEGGN